MPKSRPTRAEIESDVLYAVNDQGVPIAVVAQDLDLSQGEVRRILRKYERMERNEEKRMANHKRSLTPEQEADVLARIAAGELQKDIAAEYGVAQSTITRIKKMAQEGAEMTERTIAGDKANGTLRCIGADTYEGTCKRSNGRMSKRTFRTTGAKAAESAWEKWCAGLREEDAAKAAPPVVGIEAMLDAVCQDAVTQTLADTQCDEPQEPRHVNVIDVPSVTLDVTDRFDESLPLLELLDALEPRDQEADDVSMDAVAFMMLLDMVRRAVTPEPAEVPSREDASAGLPFGPVYLTYVDGKGPHAAFKDGGKARQVCDTMNAALEFAGVEARYEVMEVDYWQG